MTMERRTPKPSILDRELYEIFRNAITKRGIDKLSEKEIGETLKNLINVSFAAFMYNDVVFDDSELDQIIEEETKLAITKYLTSKFVNAIVKNPSVIKQFIKSDPSAEGETFKINPEGKKEEEGEK